MGWKRSPSLEALKAPTCSCLFLQAPVVPPVTRQINFLLSRPSLLGYTLDGTCCWNLVFANSYIYRSKTFLLCFLYLDQEVLVGSGDAYTVPGNMKRGKEH